jgi:predicted nucleotidyltransferase
MLTSKEILIFLKENKEYFREHFYCSKIGLFGSFSRNEQTEKSDIDIIVEFNPDTPDLYGTEIELNDFLRKRFNRKIDICAEKWIKPIFKPLILKDIIYA